MTTEEERYLEAIIHLDNTDSAIYFDTRANKSNKRIVATLSELEALGYVDSFHGLFNRNASTQKYIDNLKNKKDIKDKQDKIIEYDLKTKMWYWKYRYLIVFAGVVVTATSIYLTNRKGTIVFEKQQPKTTQQKTLESSEYPKDHLKTDNQNILKMDSAKLKTEIP